MTQGHWEEHVKTEKTLVVCYTAKSPRMPRVVGSHQNLEEKHGIDTSTETPERTNSAETFILYFWYLEL